MHPLGDGLKIGRYHDDGLRFEDVDSYGSRLPPRHQPTSIICEYLLTWFPGIKRSSPF